MPVLRTVFIIFAAIVLTACEKSTIEQQRLCAVIVPALHVFGAEIEIQNIVQNDATPERIRLDYTRDGSGSFWIQCNFDDQITRSGRYQIKSLQTSTGQFDEIDLHILKRYWLADQLTLIEAEDALSWASNLRPKAFLHLQKKYAYLLQQMLNALPLVSIYMLLALAYSLIYGLTNRINLAFGDLAVVGGFASLSAITLLSGISIFLHPVLLIAFGALFALINGSITGYLSGSRIFLPLSKGSSQPVLVASIGLAIALQEGMRLIFGNGDHWIAPLLSDPLLISDGPFDVVITPMKLIVIVSAISISAMTLVLMKCTQFGRNWRAVSDDSFTAELMGVSPRRIGVQTFSFATMLAALSGSAILFQYGQLGYYLGLMIGLKALIASIIGGIGSPLGAILGALIIGFGETLWSAYLPLAYRDVAVLSLLIIVLMLRPTGLLGLTVRYQTDRP